MKKAGGQFREIANEGLQSFSRANVIGQPLPFLRISTLLPPNSGSSRRERNRWPIASRGTRTRLILFSYRVVSTFKTRGSWSAARLELDANGAGDGAFSVARFVVVVVVVVVERILRSPRLMVHRAFGLHDRLFLSDRPNSPLSFLRVFWDVRLLL